LLSRLNILYTETPYLLPIFFLFELTTIIFYVAALNKNKVKRSSKKQQQ